MIDANGTTARGRHICTQCGYIYDPQSGDSFNGIAPGTLFGALPDMWVCPMCYAKKELFDPLD
jgi:rubredoxin